MKRVVKWLLTICVLGALGWAAWTYWPRDDAKVVAQEGFSATFVAQIGAITASISPTGEVYTETEGDLSFDAKGLEIIEINVSVGDRVQAGDVLARIDTASLEADLDSAEASLLSAEDALEQAQTPYDDIDLHEAEANVTQAQVNLEEAKETLDELLNPDLVEAAEAITEAEWDLRQAKDDLTKLQIDPATQENIDYLQWQANELEAEHGQLVLNTNESEMQVDYRLLVYNRLLDAREEVERAELQAQVDLLKAENDVTTALDALEEAQEALAELEAGPDPLEIRAAQNAVAQAEYDLAKAKDDLATVEAGADPNDVQLAQARYDSALAAYEDAEEALAEAVLMAPFDGTVASIDKEVGDLVTQGGTIMTLKDLTELRILASIDETQISDVEVGQVVAITFDAFPGEEFEGAVLEIPIEGSLMSNVVTYDVPISLEGADEVSLRPGMTANLTITVGSKEDALLVPVMAVQQSTDGTVVTVQNADGTTTLVPVQTGLSDGVYIEIVGGLIEGDVVVVEYSTDTEETQMPGGGSTNMMRMMMR